MSFIKYLLLVFFPSALLASIVNNNIAEVVKIRGVVTQLSPGARLARYVVQGDMFVEDTSIVTGPKSFVKIKLIDNTELNIGPESKIIISQMKPDSEGVISLLKGKLRTEVQKSVKNSTANKFFIKTRSAALGVRGTDFQTIYNPENKMTSLLTYKGEVAMAKFDELAMNKVIQGEKIFERDETSSKVSIQNKPELKLDEAQVLNKILGGKEVVLVPPGQNSFANDKSKKASLPVEISPVQLVALYNNADFQEKASANLNLKSADDSINSKSSLVIAKQTSPAEGYFNAKTGDFAPKSGGYVDLNTGLYIAPDSDANLDSKSGVYVSRKIGDIDSDTGQYVAPKGLILDAKKGFIIDESDADVKGEKKPELLALREDLNKTITKDIFVDEATESLVDRFNIDEKFIRDRISFSLWSLSQNIVSNKGESNSPFLEINSAKSMRLSMEWAMSSTTRFSPLIGLDYSSINFKENNVLESSKSLSTLTLGSQYALSRHVNLFAKIGLTQEHFLDQTSAGFPYSYELKKVVLTRLSTGSNFNIWEKSRFSLESTIGALFSFRKSINNIVINEGAGFFLEALPRYKLSNRKWLGIGFKIEEQYQRVNGSLFTNRLNRKTDGVELKFMGDF